MSNPVCSQCGGETDNGYIATHGRESVDFITLNPATNHDSVSMNAYACLSCGNVDICVDPEHLRKIVGK